MHSLSSVTAVSLTFSLRSVAGIKKYRKKHASNVIPFFMHIIIRYIFSFFRFCRYRYELTDPWKLFILPPPALPPPHKTDQLHVLYVRQRQSHKFFA